VSDTEWFPQVTQATAHDALFVQRIREHARGWQRFGLSAERSDTLEIAVPFLGVELPHLTTDLRWLWITFTDDDGFTAECRWGDEEHFDDVGRSTEIWMCMNRPERRALYASLTACPGGSCSRWNVPFVVRIGAGPCASPGGFSSTPGRNLTVRTSCDGRSAERRSGAATNKFRRDKSSCPTRTA